MSPFTDHFATHLTEHTQAIAALEAFASQVQPIAEAWATALKNGHKILFFGNGGSAADAQHFAAELVVRYRSNRRALAGIALTTDTSILTAHSNDFGFETVFARQIEALARPGDVAVGISTSGTSQSIIAGLQAANQAGCVTVCFTGQATSPCSEISSHVFHAPATVTARIQECHLLVGHLLCDWVEKHCC
jgi:D-sedoheptulose 7-phosphate isomerase